MDEGRRGRNDSTEVAQRKIFIGGLSYGTDDDKLRKYFGVYGAVQDAVVMKDPVSRRSRGFGFITYADMSSVDNALANEPHTIDSRKVEAKRAVPRSEAVREVVAPAKTAANRSQSTSSESSAKSSTTQPPGSPVVSVAGDPTKHISSSNSSSSSSSSMAVIQSPSHAQIMNESRNASDPRIAMDEYAYNKIFVGGLHYDTRDADFKAYFEQFGKVISAEVMFNRETHKSRGFGFIVFEQENGAERVVAEREHVIDGKVVEVKRAIPRSRITPNGTILPPPPGAVRGVGTGPGLPLVRSVSGTGAVAAAVSSANAKLIRQDVKRSTSMGQASPSGLFSPGSASSPTAKPSPLGGGVGGVGPRPLQSLAASLATIGVPHPQGVRGKGTRPSATTALDGVASSPGGRVVAGPSYAAALKLGSGADDSDGSLTDQVMFDGLQADLLQGTQVIDGGLGGVLGAKAGMAIERPSRSSSISEPMQGSGLGQGSGHGGFNQSLQGQGQGQGQAGGGAAGGGAAGGGAGIWTRPGRVEPPVAPPLPRALHPPPRCGRH